ncbi:hypothetical protein DBB29_12145 [Pandoraea cepalis]|uniref:EamA domain-containing protein n=1 Tax=Pandoraea cepalis TaxID=2508294 RepID=A0AAW7MTI1_9BURK|nr:DMT family transporter [Pandoraea cepalis]MDN4576204.1 hypothetical protein [Pandoraea cepalis]MDN4578866.1 hypothetical protein [Pandoraea cepalis]
MPDLKLIFGILFLGFVWAGETALGKLYLANGGTATEFPALLNLGTVVIVSAYAVARGDIEIFSLSARKARAIFLSAISLIFVPYLIIYHALSVLTPAEIALISSLTPACAVLLTCASARSWPELRAIAAVLVGLIGTALLVATNGEEKIGTDHAFWIALMLLVPLSYALSGFAIKLGAKEGVGYLQLTLFINTISLALFVCTNEYKITTSATNYQSILYIVAGIVFNIAASSALLILARRTSAIRLSFSNYSTIFWASLMSVFLFSKPIEVNFFVAAALIVLSVYLVNVAGSADRTSA